MSALSATVPHDLLRLRERTYYDPSFDLASQLFYLGLQYGQQRNDELAAVCFLALAAERNHPEAQFLLSQYYFQGKGGPASTATALDWLQRAAHNDCVEAMYILGQLYLNGDEVCRDVEAARDWFRRCSIRGHTEAMAQLLQIPHHTPQATTSARAASSEPPLHRTANDREPPVQQQLQRRESEPSKMRAVPAPAAQPSTADATAAKLSFESAVHNIALL